MVNLLTPLSDIEFIYALREVELRLVDTPSVDFEFRHGDDVLFSNRYYPDNHDSVVIYDLDVLAGYVLESGDYSHADGFGLYADGEPLAENMTIVRSGVMVKQAAADFLANSFLTLDAGARYTSPTRFECVTSPEGGAVNVVASYYNLATKMPSTQVFTLTAEAWHPLNVSSALFQVPVRGRLYQYSVRQGARCQTYRVVEHATEWNPGVIFRNNFGVWDTFYFTGRLTSEPEYERNFVDVGTRLVQYNTKEIMYYTAKTGPMARSAVPLLYDMLRSSKIYLIDNHGSQGDEILIKEQEVETGNGLSEIPDLSIKYRRADRLTVAVDAIHNFRVFDNTFDNTYG